ncbi:MAG: hypothetical protein RIB84_21790 [Sneathiellaceae bacterium]
MTPKQKKMAAFGGILAGGLAIGAITAAHTMTGPETIPEGMVDTRSLMNDGLISTDNRRLGYVINVLPADDGTPSYLIVDRGIGHDPEARFVPVRPDSLVPVDDRTMMVNTPAAEFDTAPAFSGAGMNAGLATWPADAEAFWQDKRSSHRIPLWLSEAARVRPLDLSVQPTGYPPAEG